MATITVSEFWSNNFDPEHIRRDCVSKMGVFNLVIKWLSMFDTNPWITMSNKGQPYVMLKIVKIRIKKYTVSQRNTLIGLLNSVKSCLTKIYYTCECNRG